MKFFINRFIKYLENTSENDWQLEVCANKELNKFCVMGHLYKWAAGKKENHKRANRFWRYFEEGIATTYMIFPVNDGTDSNYSQNSAKKRCIAYLKDLRDGKSPTTLDCIKEYESKT